MHFGRNSTSKYVLLAIMLVLHDDCWNPEAKSGAQPPAPPRRILSNWVQCPGKRGLQDEQMQNTLLKDYVQTVIRRFGHDKRVAIWDLYNEPGNNNLSWFCITWFLEIPNMHRIEKQYHFG